MNETRCSRQPPTPLDALLLLLCKRVSHEAREVWLSFAVFGALLVSGCGTLRRVVTSGCGYFCCRCLWDSSCALTRAQASQPRTTRPRMPSTATRCAISSKRVRRPGGERLSVFVHLHVHPAEVKPHNEEWIEKREYPMTMHRKFYESGLSAIGYPAELGGTPLKSVPKVDYFFELIRLDESARLCGGHVMGQVRVRAVSCGFTL